MQDLYLTINFDTRSLQKNISVLIITSVLTREGEGVHILEQIFGKTFCLFTHYSFFFKLLHIHSRVKSILHCLFLLYNPLQTICFKNFTKCFFFISQNVYSYCYHYEFFYKICTISSRL